MTKNVIVGQSGGPTAVINSSLAGVYKTAKDLGAKKVYGMRYGIEGLLSRNIMDMSEKIRSDTDLELLKRTPASFLGSCRYKLPEISENRLIYEHIFEILNKYDIEAFLYIGGNDSMDTIKKLSDYASLIGSPIRFIGVPKTIDNDLAVTDHTPGYGSAAKYIATTIKELVRDSLVYDIKSVLIIEIMGRNAGWLTGAAALAKGDDSEGADLIYLPELPFDPDSFIERIKETQKTKKSVVVAVSEGIKTSDGKYVSELGNNMTKLDSFGHTQLSGTAKYLSALVFEKIGCKSRAVELSTLQRCAGHLTSYVDVTEAYEAGGCAVKAADNGESGKMVILKRTSETPYISATDLYDIHKIANIEKKVPLDWILPDGAGITDKFINYIRPLIQGELTQIMVAGEPKHIVADMPE